MKKLLWAGLLALPLLALPSEVKAFTFGNYEVDTGAKVWCNVKQLNLTTPTSGPWYLYWPYWAHFQTPAPGVNPYFPPPMTLPPGFGAPPPGAMPPAQAYGAVPPGYYPRMPAAGQGYQAPMPSVAQGYPGYQGYPGPAQGYPGMQAPAQGYPGYQAPMPQQGPPHPQVVPYFDR
jgi:hypothetical protein